MTSRYFQFALVMSIVAIAVAMVLIAIDDGQGSKNESAPAPVTRELAPRETSGGQESESENDADQSFRTIRQRRVVGKGSGY